MVSEVTALASLVISLVALIRSRKAERATAELRERQRELIEEQLQHIRRDAAERTKADLQFTKIGDCLVLSNQGEGAAYNVRLTAEAVDGRRSPLMEDEIMRKVPIPDLHPGQSTEFRLSLAMGMSSRLRVTLAWEGEDGATEQRSMTVDIF